MKDTFMNRCLRVEIYTNEQGPGKEYFRLNGDGDAISEKYIRNKWGSAILWVLDYQGRKITGRGSGWVRAKGAGPPRAWSRKVADFSDKIMRQIKEMRRTDEPN
jgi:hypothetical protein